MIITIVLTRANITKITGDARMKLHIKSFCITALIIGTMPLLILFIWCSINGFGIEVVRIFESIHPSGGLSIFNNLDKSLLNRLPGIIINTAYAALDSFIFGITFSSLYNFFISKFESQKSEGNK
jgi:hypothetical protein